MCHTRARVLYRLKLRTLLDLKRNRSRADASSHDPCEWNEVKPQYSILNESLLESSRPRGYFYNQRKGFKVLSGIYKLVQLVQ